MSSSAAIVEAIDRATDRIVEAIKSLRLSAAPADAVQAAGAPAAKVVRKKRQESPVQVSEELAKFAGLDAAAHITRQEATKAVMQYVKDNSLQDSEDRRNIVPDSALAKLLASGDVVSVLGLKSALKAHFTAVE